MKYIHQEIEKKDDCSTVNCYCIQDSVYCTVGEGKNRQRSIIGIQFSEELFNAESAKKWVEAEHDLVSMLADANEKSVMIKSKCVSVSKYKLYRYKSGENLHFKLRIKTEENDSILSCDINSIFTCGDKLKISNYDEIHSDWFSFEGIINRGNPGTTKENNAEYLLLDYGDVEIGANREDFKEYFFDGNMMDGRFVFSKHGNSEWSLCNSKLNIPCVLQDRSVKSGWAPEKGISALPLKWKKLIPKGLKYWESDCPVIVRDILVERIKLNNDKNMLLSLEHMYN